MSEKFKRHSLKGYGFWGSSVLNFGLYSLGYHIDTENQSTYWISSIVFSYQFSLFERLVLLTYLVVDIECFIFQVPSVHSVITMADVAVSQEWWGTSVTVASLGTILSLRLGAGKIF